jgi:hypothetical protein
MQYRRFFAFGLWLAVTTAATAMVWMATSIVAAEVTDRPPPAVGHREVVMALQSGQTDAKTDPGIGPTGAPTPSTTAPPSGSAAPPAAPGQAAPAPAPGPVAPGVATTAPPAAPPTTSPVSPPTTPPPSKPTATYSTAGGVISVSCNGYFIDLMSATPANGFAARVITGGPYYVEVHFVRPGRDVPIWAFCMGTPVRIDAPGANGRWPPGF